MHICEKMNCPLKVGVWDILESVRLQLLPKTCTLLWDLHLRYDLKQFPNQLSYGTFSSGEFCCTHMEEIKTGLDVANMFPTLGRSDQSEIGCMSLRGVLRAVDILRTSYNQTTDMLEINVFPVFLDFGTIGHHSVLL